MERLTVADEKLENGRTLHQIIDGNAVRTHAMEFYWRLKKYEDIGAPEEITDNMEIFKSYRAVCGGYPPEKIQEWVDAEREGRLVVLPCRVGTTIYQDGDTAYPIKIDDIGFWLEAGEESEWITLSEFEHDFKKEIEAALESKEGEK